MEEEELRKLERALGLDAVPAATVRGDGVEEEEGWVNVEGVGEILLWSMILAAAFLSSCCRWSTSSIPCSPLIDA